MGLMSVIAKLGIYIMHNTKRVLKISSVCNKVIAFPLLAGLPHVRLALTGIC